MHTFLLLLSSLGFFMLYNTSKRAKLSSVGIGEQWLQVHPKLARMAGSVLLLLSVVLLLIVDGLGVGLFSAFILLMTSACYWIAIAPLYYFRWKHILAFSVLSVCIELFIF